MQHVKFTVSGMTCAACSANIEKTVGKLNGVGKAEVNLLANSMVAEYDPALTSTDAIMAAVEKIGYSAAPVRQASGKKQPVAAANISTSSTKQRLIVSFVFLVPLLYLSMGSMFGLPQPAFLSGMQNALSFALTQFLLTLPIIVVNRIYFTSGFKALWHKTPNMYSLIALGAAASLGYGIFALYQISWGLGSGTSAVVHHYSHELYFESAATILALITLGKALEDRSKGRTGKAIGALLSLAPKTALRVENGVETEIPLEDVQIGDILAVKPGAAIPADGTVQSGSGAVNESAITGESLPVEKQIGDDVTCGAVNTSGYFTMRATRVGEDTTLAQIVKLVEEAGASKAPIAKLADKVAGIFVPIVMGIALVCFIVWLAVGSAPEFALARAVTVLVISCPCALGLATPVAIMVGTGRGAKNGILYKNAAALEELSHVDTFVLDKTGTITEGKPSLTDVITYAGYTQNQLMQLALTLEAKSEHPVALAITSAAYAAGFSANTHSKPFPFTEDGEKPIHFASTEYAAENFESLSGLGVRANVNGQTSLAGNARLMQENGIDITPAENDAAKLANSGKTPLYFAQGGKLCGLIAVADLPKATSKTAIAALKNQGITAIMLTGDNAATAQAIRKTVGIDEAIAQVLPKDKDNAVKNLQAKGHTVAMVGDGINDAPALTRADVGIAIGAGTDVAIESADIVLMHSTLADAVTAHKLSRATMRNIKQNLFWAFIYNIVCIPIAAGVFYVPFGLLLNPMFGAAAMSLSSIFVVGNALRLNAFKAPAPQLQSAQMAIIDMKTNMTKENTPMEKKILIEGMSCGHCTAHVQKALNALPGVSANVNLATKTATVTLTENTSDDALRKAVEDAGYEVVGITGS